MSIDSSLASVELIEQMYAKYQNNPTSVDTSWQRYFQNLELEPLKKEIFAEAPADLRIYHLIDAYRKYGHFYAKINPIATKPVEVPYELKLGTLGFLESELNIPFPTCGILPSPTAQLRDIIKALHETYCDKIGVEYMGLQRPDLEEWLQQRIEPNHFKINLTIDQKRMILQHLNKSELFESFLHTKYVGQKRFSLEGAETLIPIIEAILETGALLGAEEFVVGMAHRGRLNVLSNILKKSYAEIFSEFEEGYIPESFEGSGDVKYHKGYLSEVLTIQGHKVRVDLTPNPSHLESVNPVVEGQVFAKQLIKKDEKKEKVIPILVHGDAALSGQGVVYETMQMYHLDGYSTGGSVHIVINNQIGFTTLPNDARSTYYCTAIAQAFGAPVFHVDAEDPEGCIFATILAAKIRQKFHCDVFIDLMCYRKYGHNESDEPAFTQPLEYQLIRKKKSIREIYRDYLIEQGIVERKMAEALEVEFKSSLQEALKTIKIPTKSKTNVDITKHSQEPYTFNLISTGVPKNLLQELAQLFCTIPEGFTIHPKLQNLLKERLEMVREGPSARPMDWGMAETLAYATLLWTGTDVRLSGQDSCRGTFSHRHGMWMDQVEEKAYFPLEHLKKDQGRFDLLNSPLSEFAVLGFELGYSVARSESLTIWEAQFGDFSNGGQVIIDEYITTCEQKWGQVTRLVMLLPHGYEGQGPDHSSGRIERYLSLCGNDNIQVANPTTPAQLFHLLRRQVLMKVKKPLVVFTPKGLLRNPDCVSNLLDLTQGSFQTILHEPNPPKKASKIVFCSGRIYFDIASAKTKYKVEDMAIIRIEQLYPFDIELLKTMLKKLYGFNECFWVQEEPSNMGAWTFIQPILNALLDKGQMVKYIGRERSASPAVGSLAVSKKEQSGIINTLFGKLKPSIFEIAGESS